MQSQEGLPNIANTVSPAERLLTPIANLRGGGPERAEMLSRLKIRTVRDLLYHFPRDYQDFRDLTPIADLVEEQAASVRGEVTEISARQTRRGAQMLGILIFDGEHALRATWFNQSFMRSKFQTGQQVLLSGKARLKGMRWEMAHPRVQWLDSDEGPPQGKMLPLYPLTEGISQGQLRYLQRVAVGDYAQYVEEVFPDEYLAAHNLWPIQQAIAQIHFPDSPDQMAAARRRFVYQELFILQLGLALRRQTQAVSLHAAALECSAKIDARIRRLFPFELTPGQEQAIREITGDMGRTIPMNRLLQGDVGSGKTVVAIYAILLAVAHGYQAALMAPTEVLARQHARTIGRMLERSQVRTSLLVGTLTSRERETALVGIRNGDTQVVIGTHAILSDDVEFAKLGLVVIDEQHKFGVQQRSGLREAGENPHYLVMTATPIPRTVTMTLYGDLDTSTLRESPPGRQKLYTYLGVGERPKKWWDFLRRKLREGRQGYVVVPLIEESEMWDAASLQAVHESLANGELSAFRLGILHGRMPAEEKETVMLDFVAGKTQVLISTSVIEVGVDVANATLMTIYDAERFGLAQLHQLRGRVHRGSYPGYCCLFPGVEKEELSEEAVHRLEALVDSTDGFHLAEVDFKLRGPGDLFGTRQHGLPPFRMADLIRDAEIVAEARRDAQQLVTSDPGMQNPAHAKLRRMVIARYGKALELGDVG